MASTSIPQTMKGVLIEKTGGVEVLQYKTDLPVPTLKAGEVLVKNEFIGINYIDMYATYLFSVVPSPASIGLS
jgi:NADPH2:quinone reductase